MRELFYIYGFIYLGQRIHELLKKREPDPEGIHLDVMDWQNTLNILKKMIKTISFKLLILDIVWVWFGLFSEEFIYFISLILFAILNVIVANGKGFEDVKKISRISAIIRILIIGKVLYSHYHQINFI